MKYIYVEFNENEIWKFPASIVADNRAKYYSERDKDTTYEEEYEFTMSDESELIDWMMNNMDWCDVSSQSIFVSRKEIDYDMAWLSVEHWVKDEQR